MAADSTMPETEVHEEIGRRTIQITDLKEELWDLRDRIEAVDHRSDTLVQGLAGKAHEIGVCKSKANNLEDKVALLKEEAEEQLRRLKRGVADGAALREQSQEQLSKAEEATASALAHAKAERQRGEVLKAEASSLAAQIQAAQRQLAHEREQLAQDEAAETARQARADKAFEKEEAERREDSNEQLSTAKDAAHSVRLEVLRLEKALSIEKDSIAELEKSLGDTSSREMAAQKTLEEQCNALEDELESLQLQTESDKIQAETKSLEDELAQSRRDVQRLSQLVANSKSETAFKRQNLQGALDETRGMLQDHLDRTQAAPPDSGLEVLVQALADAKSRAVEQQTLVARLELESNSLQAELHQIEAVASDASRQAPTDQQHQHTELTLEARAMEQQLRAATRRADDKAVEAVRAEAKVIEEEKLAKQREAVLRRKLVELWSWLRQTN